MKNIKNKFTQYDDVEEELQKKISMDVFMLVNNEVTNKSNNQLVSIRTSICFAIKEFDIISLFSSSGSGDRA